nr:hypothetical protein [Tanacetum cinerariifolium]GEX16217.1 hypothetical protein [Tanacetum cinerariifolium]GEX97762.1 hypothetical protein [Tanacetum cinerariifolium]
GWGGRGVKEKDGVAQSAKEKSEAVKDVVAPSVMVESRTGTQEANSIKADDVNLHDENVGKTPKTPTGNTLGMFSYANVAGAPSRKSLNFCTLYTPRGNEVDVVVLVVSIRSISVRFANMVYGFFLRKRVAYPVVANYNPDVNLLKEDVGNVSVWVNLHGVPMTSFSKDGLSAIATKLGTPLMIDSYTSDMCNQSWDKSSYARAMIEVREDVDLNNTIVAYMPKHIGEGFYTCNFRVEYEWNPSKCASCKVFWHGQDECPKNIDSGRAKNNVGFSSLSTTPIVEKIDKIEKLIIDGQLTLVDDEGKPIEKVDYLGDHDSEDEVASTDNDMTNFLASEKVGYGDKSMLEQ